VSNDATSVVGASCDDADSEVARKAAHLAADPHFKALLAAWPQLSEEMRAAVRAMVEAAV